MFFCVKCQREPRELGTYAAMAGDGPGFDVEECRKQGIPVLDCGEGYIHGFVVCHGENAEIYASFDDVWKAIDLGARIDVFADPDAPLPAASEPLPLPPARPERKRLRRSARKPSGASPLVVEESPRDGSQPPSGD